MKKNRYLVLGLVFGLILIGVAYALTLIKTPSPSSQPTPSPSTVAPAISGTQNTTITPQVFSQKLIYWVKTGQINNIYAYDGAKKQLLFTDGNEKQKVLTFSNLSSSNPSLLALTSTSQLVSIGNLYRISMNGQGNMVQIAKDFATIEPPLPIISPNNLKIAYVIFSNAEIDYGYSLYTMSTDGTNKRKIASEPDGIFSPVWSPDSQAIVYIKGVQGNGSFIKRVNLSSQKSATSLYETSQPIINLVWLSANQLAFSTQSKAKNQIYTVYSININKGSKPQILDSQIPAIEFLLSNKQDIIYLSANHDVFKYNILNKQTEQIKLENVQKLLGWLP